MESKRNAVLDEFPLGVLFTFALLPRRQSSVIFEIVELTRVPFWRRLRAASATKSDFMENAPSIRTTLPIALSMHMEGLRMRPKLELSGYER